MKKHSSLSAREIVLAFVVLLGVILVFAFFDFLAHLVSEEYAVPDYYFRNKILFGTALAFITWFFVRHWRPVLKAMALSVVVAFLLQVRYFLEGYSLDFVILFLFVHGAILFLVSWLFFRLLRDKI